MLRPLPLLLLALAAPLGCGPARASLELERLPRTSLGIARCLTSGLAPPIQFSWTLAPGLSQWGFRAPKSEPALAVTLPAQAKGPLTIACTAIDAAGVRVQAQSSFAPIAIHAVRPPGEKSALLTVEGSGFGATRAGDDGLYLVPLRGPALAADPGCQGGTWSDSLIRACVPPQASGRSLQVRVESGGRLAIAPGAPLAFTGSPLFGR